MLLGTDDPALRPVLDQLTARAASTLDVRDDTAWTEVPDGRAFLRTVLEAVPEGRDHIRLAHASPTASGADRERRALDALRLADLAVHLEEVSLDAGPPQFTVRYQPIVDLTADEVVGFEALLRATVHDVRVDTGNLIDRAGRGGWSHELDALGRRLALRGVGPWLGEGLLFLNLLAPEGRFDLDAVRATVAQAIDNGLDPDQLVLEITERNRYIDLAGAAADIASMRELGVRIAVDDVGDGHSSLTVVAAFEPDIVKITGRLTGLLPSHAARAAIRAIVGMAHETRSWVIAESVETDDQADQLRALGVDWAQGHLFGPASSHTS